MGEGSTREVSDKETPEQEEARNDAFVLIERYQKRQELFTRIHSLRYRFMAQHGRDAGKPFEELWRVIGKLVASSRQLARLWERQRRGTPSDDEYARIVKQAEDAESVFWEGDPEIDPIALEVDRIVDSIERTCRGVMGV
ncbi:MAG: hypothetical protein PVI86_17480 [Phycisphaerae bacterium]